MASRDYIEREIGERLSQNSESNESNQGNNENNQAEDRAARTSQLLQHLNPLMASLSRRPSPRSLTFQLQTLIRSFIFIEISYIYLLDHSLLLFLTRQMGFIIFQLLLISHSNAIFIWSFMVLTLMMYHLIEVFILPAGYFEIEGFIRVFGPSTYNWLKLSSSSIGGMEFWFRRIFLITERALCHLILLFTGYLSLYIDRKRDSIITLRGGQPRDQNRQGSEAEEEVQITMHSNIIESNYESQISHRQRSSTQERNVELQDVNERSNLLQHADGNDEDIFDTM